MRYYVIDTRDDSVCRVFVAKEWAEIIALSLNNTFTDTAKRRGNKDDLSFWPRGPFRFIPTTEASKKQKDQVAADEAADRGWDDPYNETPPDEFVGMGVEHLLEGYLRGQEFGRADIEGRRRFSDPEYRRQQERRSSMRRR